MQRRTFLGAGVLLPVLTACGGGGGGGGSGSDGSAQAGPFRVDLMTGNFTLGGQPFQIRSGEMHPSRIRPEYWQHRIRMAKAMGLNAIALYVMWNYHEKADGSFDFVSGDRDIVGFIRLCQQEGMQVLLRPGPYICGSWDFGGLPSYLLEDYPANGPVRSNSTQNPRYIAACQRYFAALAEHIRPLMHDQGGPILMVQVENELATWTDGPNPQYLAELEAMWRALGINGPFAYQDGYPQALSPHGNPFPKGSIFGLSNPSSADMTNARESFPQTIPYAGEIWAGFDSYWGDPALSVAPDHSALLTDLMVRKLSFSLYVVHGGTNFGFNAGSLADDLGVNFKPQMTSYDYDAVISENGTPKPLYFTYRNLIGKYVGGADSLPPVPALPPRLNGASLPAVQLNYLCALTSALPAPRRGLPQPVTLERLEQRNGCLLYRFRLPVDPSGMQLIPGTVHDYATVYLNGGYLGAVSRRDPLPSGYTQAYGMIRPGQPISFPEGLQADKDGAYVLDVLVESTGHLMFNTGMHTDAKGLLSPVQLQNKDGSRTTLSELEVFQFPLTESDVASLQADQAAPKAGVNCFVGSFELASAGDVYLDMRAWAKGMVWVNGHALGRYWQIGPQHALYCPGVWLKAGRNDIRVIDLHLAAPATIPFCDNLKGETLPG